MEIGGYLNDILICHEIDIETLLSGVIYHNPGIVCPEPFKRNNFMIKIFSMVN